VEAAKSRIIEKENHSQPNAPGVGVVAN